MGTRRRLTLAMGLAAGWVPGLAVVSCGDPEPAVEVSTYVGPSHGRHDDEARREHARQVATTVLAELARPHAALESTPQAAFMDAPIHAPTDPTELRQLIEAIDRAPLDELGGPARRLAAAGPAVWPEIRQALLADLPASKRDYRSVLDAIGGDVPNRYGHFARSWKKAHGYDVKLSQDWFEDLLLLPPGRLSRGLHGTYRDSVRMTAMFRAATLVGREDPSLTHEVVATLLHVAYAHEGLFRDEVGRAITGIGDEAIPHLLVESLGGDADDREDVDALRGAYARVALDTMDRLHPQRATSAVRDEPRLLSLVLHAYATVRLGEAASVLLDFVDAADPTVRSAARAAFFAYVEGPPPQAERRTIRLLGGGTSTARAHLTYRQRAAIAIRERMQAEVPQRLEPECEIVDEDGRFHADCEAQPERLTRIYFEWLDERRAASIDRALAAALAEPDVQRRVEQIDRLLAANPTLEVSDRIVAVIREAAAAAEAEGDMERAGQLWRKAARLAEPSDPRGGETLRVRALLAEASVPALTREGRQMLLASARRIAPEDPRIQSALDDLQRARGAELGAPERWTPVGGMVLGLWSLGVLGTWWRRRRG
ncbi:hypothetical protein [Paraliomyxa miuraensis]|uniref:hypothetical protein n=1 Tax=Paraliomyxa miuraensis TaxID=376150 RepID=UPI00225BEF54|nr:hypothetical protein [Paraliomyxa miuraensis]MCX4244580.1 hypothetical protein [Paraliomyxa miuraensis]